MSPWPISGGVVDPFVVLKSAPELAEVSIPRASLRDRESLEAWPSMDIAGHLFRRDPSRVEREEIAADLTRWLQNLQRWEVVQAQVPVPADSPDLVLDRLAEEGDRIFLSVRVDPHDGMDGVRRLRQLCRRYPNVRSVCLAPHATYPLIAPNSREYYPIYTACVEEQLPIFITVGFPGPRIPAHVQDPVHLEDVCWFFPDLTVVLRHGGEPWVDTCVKMLQRWPNLYYATTAFAPKYYPQPIIDLLNGRGADKVIWAGYWPTLSYERLSAEVAALPLKPDRVEGFLRDNARRVFRLSANPSSSES